MELEIAQGPDSRLLSLIAGSGLDKNKADYMIELFGDYFQIASDWEAKAKAIVVTAEDQVDLMKTAREGRLFLRGKRIDVERRSPDLFGYS